MPKLWSETITKHRHEVREALLDTTAALVADGGLLAVTMSQVAAQTGIGRATLYKYFPDVESLLLAWHERQVREHLQLLADVRDAAVDPAAALRSVLEAYAHMLHRRHDSDLGDNLHLGEHMNHSHAHLRSFLADLISDSMAAGDVVTGAPAELAAYCLNALDAAAEMKSKAAVRRLVDLVFSGLHPR